MAAGLHRQGETCSACVRPACLSCEHGVHHAHQPTGTHSAGPGRCWRTAALLEVQHSVHGAVEICNSQHDCFVGTPTQSHTCGHARVRARTICVQRCEPALAMGGGYTLLDPLSTMRRDVSRIPARSERGVSSHCNLGAFAPMQQCKGAVDGAGYACTTGTLPTQCILRLELYTVKLQGQRWRSRAVLSCQACHVGAEIRRLQPTLLTGPRKCRHAFVLCVPQAGVCAPSAPSAPARTQQEQ